MENPALADKVKIYFIDKNEYGVTVAEEVKIDKIDGITIENPKFFYQFASETEKIIDVGYKNMMAAGDSDDVHSD